MNIAKSINFDDVEPLVAVAEAIISASTVGLSFKGMLSSAVCIVLNGHHCLLTAGHTAAGLQKAAEENRSLLLQFAIKSELHCVEIELHQLGVAVHPGYKRGQMEGPDLGILQLPLKHLATICILQEKKFLPVSDRGLPTFGEGFYIVAGHPSQEVIEGGPSGSFEATKLVKGCCYPVRIRSRQKDNTDEDCWIVSPYPRWIHCENPDYQGVSGGGLWAVELSDNGETYSVAAIKLCGIAFYQIDGDLIVMGPNSVYRGGPRLQRSLSASVGGP